MRDVVMSTQHISPELIQSTSMFTPEISLQYIA